MKEHLVQITLSLLVNCETVDIEHIVNEMDMKIEDTTGKGNIKIDEIRDFEII